jgi:flagellar assembly protein FliH
MFETRFDDHSMVQAETLKTPEAAVDEAEPEPVFSAEDVEIAQQQGLETGREEGNQTARESIEARIAESLDRALEELDALFAAHDEAVTRAQREAISVAVAVAGKLFPALNEKHGLDEVTEVVQSALATLTDEPRVIIRVAPELAESLRARVERVIQSRGLRGDAEVLADADVAHGDCRLAWSDGASERNAAGLKANIEEIVARHTGGAMPEGGAGGHAAAEAEPAPDHDVPGQDQPVDAPLPEGGAAYSEADDGELP